jgi:HEAT repeat protein
MNLMSVFKKTTSVLTASVLLLAAISLIGCSKKQDQKAKSPPAPNSIQQKSAQEQTGPALPADVNKQPVKIARKSPKDPNRSARFRAVLEQELTKELTEQKKSPSPDDVNETKKLAEMNVAQFDSLKSPDEKTDFISEFSEAHPESVVGLANKALDDENVDVRSAAIEALAEKEAKGLEALAVCEKALNDKDENIRQAAVEAGADIEGPQSGKLTLQALDDPSENVRSSAIQAAEDKDAPVRLDLYKVGITSKYSDVKDTAVSSLVDMSSPAAVDILITGLKDQDPVFRENVAGAIDFLVSQEFKSYDQAKKWWDANRNKFDDELSEKDQ